MLDLDLNNPPFTTAPTIEGQSIHIWITEPAGMVTWIPRGIDLTLEDVDLIVGKASDMLRALNPEEQSWRFMHDFYHGKIAGAAIRMKLGKNF